MADLKTYKAQKHEIVQELGLTEGEFAWDQRDHDSNVISRVDMAIRKAGVRTQRRVGSHYDSTDEDIAEQLKWAEHDLACHFILRERLVRLTSRPEEAPPPEYIDVDALRAEITERYTTWDEITTQFATEDEDRPGTGFAFGAKGVDENENDASDGDFDEWDYGTIGD